MSRAKKTTFVHPWAHMPTDLTSKSRNHRQPEAFPHIPASWRLCAEYKLLIFSFQQWLETWPARLCFSFSDVPFFKTLMVKKAAPSEAKRAAQDAITCTSVSKITKWLHRVEILLESRIFLALFVWDFLKILVEID